MIEHRSPQSGVAGWGPWVATAGYDNQLILWERATRRAVGRSVHDHLVNRCRFTPDGRHVLSAGSDYTARRWTLPDLRLVGLYGPHGDDVECAVAHPADGRVATASRDRLVRVFGPDGRLLATCRGHGSDVLSVEWVDGGRCLLSSGDDGTLRRWDPADGSLLETVDLGPVEADTVVHHERTGTSVAGTDEGTLVVIGPAGRQVVAAHDAGVKQLALDEASGRLLSTGYDRRVRLWRVDGGRLAPLATYDAPPVVWLRAVSLLDAGTAAFGTFGTSYALLDLDGGAWDLEGVGPTPGLNAVRVIDGRRWTVGDGGVVSCDGRAVATMPSPCNFLGGVGDLVVTGGQTGELFDARTAEVLAVHRSPLNCFARADADGADVVIVGTYTGEVLVFAVTGAGLERRGAVTLHDNAVKCLAVVGSRLFSVSATGAVGVLDLTAMRPVRTLERAHDRIANGAAAVAGRFVSVSRDLTLRLFSLDGEPLEVVPTPHRHSVKCVAADPGGGLVATGAYDGTVALYDLVARRWVDTQRPTCAGISSIDHDPVRGVFVASSYDGVLYDIALP